jgi:hypothetical protein
MSGNDQSPPRWAETLLECLLCAAVRDAVVGDLHEEYVEAMAPRRGRLRADLWYIRQVMSFVPSFLKELGPMGKVLVGSSLFTMACACWLAFMEMILRHAGYGTRIGLALCIAIICALTILVRMLHAGASIERWLWICAAALIGIGAEAFFRNARSPHFEGFVFVISLVLVLQGLLMLMTLGRRGAFASGPKGHDEVFCPHSGA